MSSKRQRHRILIVDDDEDVAEPFAAYFAGEGYAVDVAADSDQALAAANRALPSLIILGARLADTDGLDLFNTFRARPRTAHIPVIFVAHRAESDRRNALLRAGADDFMAQPFDIDILGLRVRNAIARTEREGVIEPRTGLPTGRLLQERLRRLADEDGWAKLDIAIRDFDAFSERYDFLTADEVLLFTANLLTEVCQEVGTEDDFIGHRAGQHFVVVTHEGSGPALSARLKARFDTEVKAFYNFMDREQGYILIEDGYGGTKEAPLMTLDVKLQAYTEE